MCTFTKRGFITFIGNSENHQTKQDKRPLRKHMNSLPSLWDYQNAGRNFFVLFVCLFVCLSVLQQGPYLVSVLHPILDFDRDMPGCAGILPNLKKQYWIRCPNKGIN